MSNPADMHELKDIFAPRVYRIHDELPTCELLFRVGTRITRITRSLGDDDAVGNYHADCQLFVSDCPSTNETGRKKKTIPDIGRGIQASDERICEPTLKLDNHGRSNAVIERSTRSK